MQALSVVIVCPCERFGETIVSAVVQRGHAAALHTTTIGLYPQLRELQPDLLVLGLTAACRHEHWRLLEQLYWDPAIATRVVALVDPTLPPRHQAALRRYASAMPLLFETGELEAVLKQATRPREPFPIERLPHVAAMFASGAGGQG